MRPKKNNSGDPTKKKFDYDSEYGTAQQRLADAIAMGGNDVNRLLTVMNYMGGNTASPLEVEMAQNYTPNFYDNSPAPNMDMRSSGVGRVFQTTPGSMMRVQFPSEDPRYDYINEGGPLRAENIGSITGYSGSVGNRDARILNELLQNPDFVNYFTDIYGSADKDYFRTPEPKGRDLRAGEDWHKASGMELEPKGDATTGYTGRQLRQRNRGMSPSCKKMYGIGLFGRQKR
jgi:hypothetical protein